MDVIKAVENYSYYHGITLQSREEWEAWRVQACEEWMLDKAILGKEGEEDGLCESEPDHSGNDRFLHGSKGDCRQSRGERQHCLPDAARLLGEDGPVWESLPCAGDRSGGCN